MAELSTYNAGTHIKTGLEQAETSETTVNNEGTLQATETSAATTTQEATTAATTETNTAEQTTENNTQTQEGETQSLENEFAFSMGQDSNANTAANTQTQENTEVTYDWKQELSKIPKEELYAHLGLNEFALKLNEHLAKGGKAQDFIAINGVDFDTVPDDYLVMEDLKTKYPNLSPTELKRKYERLYGVEDENLSEQDREDKLIDLKSAAYQVRVAKKAEQGNFKMPEPIAVKDENYVQWQTQQQQEKELQNKIINYYNEHAATKSLKESKRVVINLGEGVAPFNIVLGDNDVNALTNKMAESALYQPPLLTNTGELDVAKHQLTTIFEANPQAFITQIFNYGKKMGLRGIVQEGQNAQRPNTAVSTMVSQEPVYKTSTYNQSVNGK